jgi:hypothetical protein
MPSLSINGAEVKDVQRAEVCISHGEGRSALKAPVIEFRLSAVLSTDTTVAEWAKSQQGPERYRNVVLEITNDKKDKLHKWTMKEGFVRDYREAEYSAETTAGVGGSSTELQLTNRMMVFTVTGYLDNVDQYDGNNIAQVTGG